MIIPIVIASLLSSPISGRNAVRDTLPSAVIEEWRQSAYPDKIEVFNSSPALLWASEKYNNHSDVNYRIYLSRDSLFAANSTIRSDEQRYCFFNIHQTLVAGKWFWKYDIIEGKNVSTKGIYSFTVGSNASGIITPDFRTLLSRMSVGHPRVMNQGRSLTQIRKDAPQHPLYKKIIKAGENALTAEIFCESVINDNPARQRALNIIGNQQVDLYNQLLEAYVLSGKQTLKEALLKRTAILLTWPTDDLLGSQVLAALAKGYDVLFNELSTETKTKILSVIDKQLKHGLHKWPGLTEARHVDNHFWQMELAGNFTAALATLDELPASKEMLEYLYELFIARFPNLATQEGGWAEGEGYFGVNKSAIVDMALLLKKSCGVDVFQMDWYKNLADYYFYFAPVNGRVSGFGDMHDRVNLGNIGHAMLLVEGEENQDPKALYRFASLLKADKNPEKKLAATEPWYQIVNNIKFDANAVTTPEKMERGKLFKGVGIAAFHTDLLNSQHDMALYFRSSPFGAKGHMHANQNCFNISRKGAPVFYSTGYYTSFADAHSLTSYRHTRAHNGVLVNGLGQAFGHEGYGWIKRFINGGQIGYVCGDATMAYRPTVDKQFLELSTKSNIPQTAGFGIGDAQLDLFERHLVFLPRNMVIIYDVLQARKESDWTFLLHTMDQPNLSKEGLLTLKTAENYAEAFVTGSGTLKSSLTDQFFSPVVDFKKKYGDVANQFHCSYVSAQKSKNMRFLAILQLNDNEMGIQKITELSPGHYQIGDVQIEAQLDADKPAMLTVKTSKELLKLDPKQTTLTEKVNGKDRTTNCTNLPIPSVVP